MKLSEIVKTTWPIEDFHAKAKMCHETFRQQELVNPSISFFDKEAERILVPDLQKPLSRVVTMFKDLPLPCGALAFTCYNDASASRTLITVAVRLDQETLIIKSKVNDGWLEDPTHSTKFTDNEKSLKKVTEVLLALYLQFLRYEYHLQLDLSASVKQRVLEELRFFYPDLFEKLEKVCKDSETLESVKALLNIFAQDMIKKLSTNDLTVRGHVKWLRDFDFWNLARARNTETGEFEDIE